MKKKKLFLFMALTSTIAGLTSCNVSNDNNSTNIVEQTTTTSTSSQAQVYNLEDNELSQKVFNEIKKSLPNITYDEFLLYGRKIAAYSDHIVLEYSSIRISIALDGTFRSKSEYTYDDSGNLLTQADSKYENNAWVYTYKSEYTYDANGKRTTETYSRYINNEWIKTTENIFINGKSKPIYLLYLYLDGTFSSRYEYTYDANGNELSFISSRYENNAWVYIYKYEYTYDANGNQLTQADSKYENNAWVYTYKSEYTYDANGNELTETNSKYENNAWVYTDKFEYTYDANGKKTTETYSRYENNAWVYLWKYEYTYDESGNQLTRTNYDYIDGNWVLQD